MHYLEYKVLDRSIWKAWFGHTPMPDNAEDWPLLQQYIYYDITDSISDDMTLEDAGETVMRQIDDLISALGSIRESVEEATSDPEGITETTHEP